MKKQIASLSLDLDNKWSYMKTHGDAGWESFPSYLDIVVPRALAFLKKRDLKITFFIVGQDAALEENRNAIASIANAGHEIGNHSFNHEPWLHLYSKEELVEEFDKTETALLNVTGKRPTGFRGPGYSLSPTVLEVLAERGYKYDCSTLPTYVGPLARAYYFFKSPKMADEEREKRKKLFGKLSDGFQSLKPRMTNVAGHDMAEIPVTTFPIIKTPIHLSYLLYIATFSRKAALLYWRAALAACKFTGTQPSLLLHPLDFLCGDDVDELKFFPGMEISLENKLALVSDILSQYTDSFDVVSMGEHASSIQRDERPMGRNVTVIGETH
ncbi:MAG: polysaccharide deacetylase family protein [Chloracidobacterium sp.]|nr:polysaccharide deacetylase family protein [Chloracidobacterium sp.]